VGKKTEKEQNRKPEMNEPEEEQSNSSLKKEKLNEDGI
jgi:hypothetical protein